jgi:hypothetical protein
MGREINEEQEFAENIDRLLAGHDVEAGEDVGEDYRTALQFAQKLKGLRDEPSPVFKNQLGRRLLSKIAEQEAERQREKKTSFGGLMGRLVPRSPVWRTATATVVVAVLAIAVFWGSGLFIQAPEQRAERSPAPAMAPAPKVAPRQPPVAMFDSGEVLNLEPAPEEAKVYLLGEEVKTDLVFRNASSESIIVAPFPPAIQINLADTGAVVRSFPRGGESAEMAASGTLNYTLVWDQRDDHGKQVEPGRYLILVSNVTLRKGTESQEAQIGFEPVIELIIQPP